MTSLYILVVFAQDAGLNPEPLYVDPRPLTFVECRHRRENELTFYEMLRNTPVYVLCTKKEG